MIEYKSYYGHRQKRVYIKDMNLKKAQKKYIIEE